MQRAFYLITVVAAAVAPWVGDPRVPESPARSFSGWPSEIGGRPVERVPLTADERGFSEAFPGEVARFTDGERHHILRWIREPTRRLHPAAHCLRESGYRVGEEGLCREPEGVSVCYEATRGATTLLVTERLFDDASGRWPHVSEWYWAATLGVSDGPWWSLTTFRAVDAPETRVGRR